MPASQEAVGETTNGVASPTFGKASAFAKAMADETAGKAPGPSPACRVKILLQKVAGLSCGSRLGGCVFALMGRSVRRP